MQMTDEQVWADLRRFAAAMKRGATVVFNNGIGPCSASDGKRIDYVCVREYDGIREIIEPPPQKKVRPLNAEEWKSVAGCMRDNEMNTTQHIVPPWHLCETRFLLQCASGKATCHPPGFPNDIRKLWVEE